MGGIGMLDRRDGGVWAWLGCGGSEVGDGGGLGGMVGGDARGGVDVGVRGRGLVGWAFVLIWKCVLGDGG